MCRILILLALITMVAYGNHGIPTAEEAKAEMISAGISDAAADGIIKIADSYKSKFEEARSDREAARATFREFHAEVDTYMNTQSAEDKAAYTAFVEKKKAQHMEKQSTSQS